MDFSLWNLQKLAHHFSLCDHLKGNKISKKVQNTKPHHPSIWRIKSERGQISDLIPRCPLVLFLFLQINSFFLIGKFILSDELFMNICSTRLVSSQYEQSSVCPHSVLLPNRLRLPSLKLNSPLSKAWDSTLHGTLCDTLSRYFLLRPLKI